MSYSVVLDVFKLSGYPEGHLAFIIPPPPVHFNDHIRMQSTQFVRARKKLLCVEA